LSLANCFKKAGKALDKKDAEAITTMVESGMSEKEAVAAHINNINTDLEGLIKESGQEPSYQLAQENDGKGRGSLEVGIDKLVLRLTDESNTTTVLHEFAHVFLTMEQRYSKEYGVNKNQQAIMDWLGVESMDNLTTEHQEKFAETFEVYLYTGKAPSLKLKKAFIEFAAWMKQTYKTLTNKSLSRANLTPEISQVFDRLLATDEAIAEAESNPVYDQFFASQEQAGMTAVEWASYQESRTKRKNKITESVTKRLLNELRSRKTKEWKEEKAGLIPEEVERLKGKRVDKIRQQVKDAPMDRAAVKRALGIQATDPETVLETDSLLTMAARKGGLDMSEWSQEGVDPANMKSSSVFNNQPVFKMRVFYKNKGMTVDQFRALAAEHGYQGDILEQVFKELGGDPVYTPEGQMQRLDQEFGEQEKQINVNKYTKPNGVDPEWYREYYGYGSVEQMINDVDSALPIKKEAAERAEARMIMKYGDMLNDGSIEREVEENVASDEHAAVILKQIKGLTKQNINRDYLKSEARRIVGGMEYGDIKPNKYYRAMIRAAKKAAKENSAEAKVQELANHYLYREALAAKERMDKEANYVKNFSKRKYKAKNVSEEHLNNAKLLANMYDLRKAPDRKLDAVKYLNWYEGQLNDENIYHKTKLLDPFLAEALITKQKEGQPPEFEIPQLKELTADQLHAVTNQIKHLMFVGAKVAGQEKEILGAEIAEFETSIIENGGKDKGRNRGVPKIGERGRKDRSSLFYSFASLKNLVRQVDGWDEFGKMHDIIYSEVQAGSNDKLTINNQVYSRFEEELDDIHLIGLSRGNMADYVRDISNGMVDVLDTQFKQFDLESGKSLSLPPESIFMMGVYWGTDSSREAIRQGFGVTDNDVMKILSTLSEDQLKTMNSVWKVNESMWPDLQKMAMSIDGVAPPKLTATPFEVNGVKLTGGHQQLYYDSQRDDMRGDTERQSDYSTIMPTKLGTLNARKGSGGKPPLLDKYSITRSMDEKIHYLAFAKKAERIASIMNHPSIRENIEKKHGEGFYHALKDNIEGITGNRRTVESRPAVASVFRLLRRALVFKHLMYSVRNTAQQTSAIPIAMTEAGFLNISKSSAAFLANRHETVEYVNELSPFMTNRATLVNREAAEYLRTVMADSKAHKLWGEFVRHGFTPQTITDSAIAYPTWLAKYESVLAEQNKNVRSEKDAKLAQKRAISAADTAVAESVGSGSDLHLGSMFSQNHSEFIKTFTVFGSWFNAYYQRVFRATHGFEEFMSTEAAREILVLPFIVAAMSSAVVGDLPGDEEAVEEWALKRWAMFMGATIPLVRDVTGSFSGFDPTTVFSAGAAAGAKTYGEMEAYLEGRQSGVKTTVDISKQLTNIFPLPSSGQIIRSSDYIDSYLQGNEGDFNAWLMLTEGKDKNK